MKKVFRNGFLLWLTIVLFDQFVGRVLHHLYFSQKTGPGSETTYIFNSMKEEAIILGSSRGRRNYNPQIIADSLGISCYNAGHDGQTIFYEQAIVRISLSRYLPKLVIIDLNPEEMYYRDLHYDRLNELAPYYHNYEEVRSIYLLKGIRDRNANGGAGIFVFPSEKAKQNFWKEHGALEEFVLPVNTEKIKMISRIYPYNSTVLDIVSGLLINRKSESGFKPLKGKISESKAAELINQNEELRNQKGKVVDQNKLNGLEEIITSLTEKGCVVIVSMSPALAPFGSEPSYVAVQQLCNKHNIYFRDYSQDSLYQNHSLFFDNHMNKEGANLFTSNLAHDIKTTYFRPVQPGLE